MGYAVVDDALPPDTQLGIKPSREVADARGANSAFLRNETRGET